MMLDAQSHFRDWLRQVRLSGCAFAAQFSGSDDGLRLYEIINIQSLDADDIAQFLDRTAARHQIGVLLGAQARGDDDIAEMLRVLDQHHRWEIAAESALARDQREIGVRMTWTTSSGMTTDAMGFAPSGFMPVTRRAPYLAVAVWAGGHENPHRKLRYPDSVGIGDAPPPIHEDKYSVTMDRTREWSEKLHDDEDIPRKHLRRLGLRLDRRAIERIFPQLLDR